MTPREIKALVKILRAQGVIRFKSADIELEMASIERIATRAPKPPQPVKDPDPDEPIKHKVEELTSLLKLSDADLVDSLFPDHSNAQDEVEA